METEEESGLRSTKEHQKQNRGTSDGLRSTERTGEEEEEDEDEELIWKENGGTRVSKTRVLRGIFSTSNAIACISSFKNSSFYHWTWVFKTQDANFPICFATWQLTIFLEN